MTEEVASARFRTGGKVREWIGSEYGVSYRLGSVYSLLARLGCSPKVPRGLHEKTDVKLQEWWKGGTRRGAPWCGSETRESVGLCRRYASGSSGNGAKGVGPSRVKVRQRVQTMYERMYLFCVVDGRRRRLLWSWMNSMRSDRIAAAINGLKRGTEVGALVWDCARGHRSELVETVGLPTVVQPAYSPELNPAERVFEEIRRWVEGKVYASIDEKVEAVNSYLRQLESDPGRVRSLAVWDWIDEAVQGPLPRHATCSD